jgi:hypothetical protein
VLICLALTQFALLANKPKRKWLASKQGVIMQGVIMNSNLMRTMAPFRLDPYME